VALQCAAVCTALQIAAHNGAADIARALIAAGAEVDVQSHTGCTALHHAVGGLHSDVAAALLRAECDCDIQNGHGSTALHIAAGKGHAEMIQARVGGGAAAVMCPSASRHVRGASE